MSSSIRCALSAGLLHLISACAVTPPAETQAKAALFRETVPVCIDQADCAAKWEAAQLWVVHNADYKLQTVTSVLLETYNSVDSSTGVAVRVTKEPVGDGKYQIKILAACANWIGCNKPPLDLMIDFNKKIAATTP